MTSYSCRARNQWKDILSERRYSDRSFKCLGRLRILIWKAENASGGKGILLNSEEVRYMQFESVTRVVF